MHLPTPLPIPKSWQRSYTMLRGALYLTILCITMVLAARVLFPLIEQHFDFRSPDSSKNNILSPRSPHGTPRLNGKIEPEGVLRADTTVVGDFSVVTARVSLAKDSDQPEALDLTLRRSYQSFLFPTGESITTFPNEIVYVIEGTYYIQRNDTLYPFVSTEAYLSRFKADYALPETASLLDRYSVSETWVGFRVGSLLGNGSGVYIVTSETEVRPVGSAEIFLALGYNFADVITVSEEELGVYTRGRIVVFGFTHPDGTLLFDQDTTTYSLIENGTKRPFVSNDTSDYLDFLIHDRGIHPILVSSRASEQTIHCTLVPQLFGGLSCTTPITSLIPGFGNDFQVEIASPKTAIDINTLTLSFETAKNTENMLTLLAQIKQRLLARFGGA